ncbi:hypothetical protein PILCRDRAFT_809902 [Piloderma croceum F 1598]|uniref:Uncharacterized protein n=1 Tax=Piloderma croceum (strain F 1598) TaxID=765440 RepID=A0A0C3BZD5_PILCF|nr:hypothetical protein PILCRDRAFT_809902 [Piloderma croceum F 1598]
MDDLNPRYKLIIGATFAVLGVGIYSTSLVSQFVAGLSHPYQHLYHVHNLNVSRKDYMVQPLITHNQTFDIAATVWLRTTESKEHSEAIGGLGQGLDETQAIEVTETPLYSDVVFRGLNLAQQNAFSVVNFSLPTAIFRNANVSNFDLRGSFILLPSSPSLLDHVTSYSTGIPKTIKPLPVRAWPFPLGSPDHREKLLVDEVLESFGVTFPLLQFHTVRSRCPSPSKGAHTADGFDIMGSLSLPLLQTTNGKPVLKNHPCIITRTQIIVVDETNIFNQIAYIKAQQELKETACGHGVPGVQPNRYLCARGYLTNGHWETLMELGVLDESTGKIQTQWAYAPYIFASRFAPGPKDLLIIPVNREDCSMTDSSEAIQAPSDGTYVAPTPPEDDLIDVTWKLSYSGRTPFQLISGAEIVPGVTVYDFATRSEREQMIGHDRAEVIHGLFGHKFSNDIHPLRRALIRGLRIALSTIVFSLDIHYWYTRRSTFSISILGTALISGSELFVELASIIAKGKGLFALFMSLLLATFTDLALPLLAIKTILRIKFGWWKEMGWVPTVRRASITRREITSARLEAATNWRHKAVVWLFLAFIRYVFVPENRFVIPSRLPAPDHAKDWLSGFSPLLLNTSRVTGKMLQLRHNLKARSFAGSYKLSAALQLLERVMFLAGITPLLVGRLDASPGLSVHEVVEITLLLATTWQALTFPNVLQTSYDDHAE